MASGSSAPMSREVGSSSSRKSKHGDVGFELDDALIVDEDNVEMVSNKRRNRGTKGPMDLYYRQEGGLKKLDCLKEQTEHDKNKEELRDHVVHMFSRWMYDAGIAFNAVTYDSFRDAIEAIGQCGPQMEPPTYHEVRTKLLNKEKECVKEEVEKQMNEAKKNGCTLMIDRWKCRNGRVLVNIFVNTPRGSIFLDTIDASYYSKTGEKMCELISNYVDQIGPENVVQVVTGDASENVLAGKFLEVKYPHLFWSPCATQCLDLMFEDIFKIPRFKVTVERAIKVSGYIYSRTRLLNLMRKITGNKEVIRPGKTRFATGLLTLERFHEEERNLKILFTSDEWFESKFSKETVGRNVKKIVLMQAFWENISDIVRIGGPLLTVLRMVVGEKKLAMGYIYEAMNKAKKTIEKAFSYKEEKYKDIFELIDRRWNNQLHKPLRIAGNYLNPSSFYENESIHLDGEVMRCFQMCLEKMIPNVETQDEITEELNAYRNAEGSFGSKLAVRHRLTIPPVDWWLNYGASAPYLTKFAMRILNLVCSSFGGEINWSFFEHIHSKKRNKLAQDRMNKLAFIKYNRALKRRYELSGTIDPILLSDIDDNNEWMTGEPEKIHSDTSVMTVENEGDDVDDLAGVDVGREDRDDWNYNHRIENTSSSMAHAKKRRVIHNDSEEDHSPMREVNEQSVPDDDFENDADKF